MTLLHCPRRVKQQHSKQLQSRTPMKTLHAPMRCWDWPKKDRGHAQSLCDVQAT
jgi:hypothetical protein